MKKKIAFMHIAKTAGTSVNDHFSAHFGADNVLVHAEGKRDRLLKINTPDNANVEFLSGHIRLDKLLRMIDLRHWVFFTCLRNPMDHVISHLQWVKALGAPENRNFKKGHHGSIQELAADLYETGLNDVGNLTRIIYRDHPVALQLFDNCQTRYLLPEKLQRLDVLEFRLAMNYARCFDCILLSEDLDRGLARVHEVAGLPPKNGEIGRSNPSRMVERPDLSDPSVAAFYEGLVDFDQRIYGAVKTRSLG